MPAGTPTREGTVTRHPELPEFKVEWIPRDGRFFVFVGPHGSGKSTLMRYFCHLVNNELGIEDWIGFSDTESGNGFLGTMLYRPFIFQRVPSDADFEYYYDLYRMQNIVAKKTGEPKRRLAIIIDDCDDEYQTLRKSGVFRKLVSNMRHLGIWVFVSVQYILQLPPSLRNQIDVLFQLRVEGPEMIEDVYKRYLKGKLGVSDLKYRVATEYERMRTYLRWYVHVGSCMVIARGIGEGSKYLSTFTWPADHETSKFGDRTLQITAQKILENDEDAEESLEEVNLAMKRLREQRYGGEM